MKENILPSSYQLDSQNLNFGEIHRQFSATKYGETLKGNIRYGRFKPDDVSNKTWEKALGSDVNNLTHLPLTRELTRSFLRHCAIPSDKWKGKVTNEAKFSADEQSLLLFTANVHDWGEAIIGDIAYIHKTEADEKKEMVVMKMLIHELFSNDNTAQECDNIAKNVTDILSKTTTKLGKAFNAVENVGYVRTGIRAWNESQNTTGTLGASLEQLGHEIIPYQMPKLLAYSTIYPPVDAYLTYHDETITNIYAEAGEKPSIKNEAWFIQSRTLWENKAAKNTAL